jgi:putative transposase
VPRANRYFLPGYVWHITHRCHQREFLLKFAQDRRRWLHWLFEAKRRYGLSVLNYVVTSNHIHLLVQDRGKGEIAKSLQLVAGRTGQEYNQRKGRLGAFWQDRYHATAIDTEQYLARCLVYVDLNMVRAGVVRHPQEWESGGYREIHNPSKRYRIIDQAALLRLFGLNDWPAFQALHRQWVEAGLQVDQAQREEVWTASLAVGRPQFVAQVQAALGARAAQRQVTETEEITVLRDEEAAYAVGFGGGNAALSVELIAVEDE